ncbi:hypothetical protein DSECCO2_638800 [anaerobic digester metagenome]
MVASSAFVSTSAGLAYNGNEAAFDRFFFKRVLPVLLRTVFEVKAERTGFSCSSIVIINFPDFIFLSSIIAVRLSCVSAIFGFNF